MEYEENQQKGRAADETVEANHDVENEEGVLELDEEDSIL